MSSRREFVTELSVRNKKLSMLIDKICFFTTYLKLLKITSVKMELHLAIPINI